MALSPTLQKLVKQGSNKYSRSSGSRIKPKEGVNRYRVIVPDPNAAFWAELGVHWIKPTENAKPTAVVGCDDVVHEQPCAICTAIDQAINSAIDEESKKLYESWRARKTILVNVLDRTKGSTTGDDPQILELTATTFGKVLEVIQMFAEEGDEAQDITDHKTGLDIMITRSGTGLNTEYTVNAAPGSSKPVKNASVEAAHDLKAHIEKEFFRGESQKALNSIASISGVEVPTMIASGQVSSDALAARTPTNALTSDASAVEDAEVVDLDDLDEDTPEPEPKPKSATAEVDTAEAEAEAEAEVDADDLDDILNELDNI